MKLEAVFVSPYIINVTGDGLDNQKNNNWERQIRPKIQVVAVKKLLNAHQYVPNVIMANRYRTYTKLEASVLPIICKSASFLNRDQNVSIVHLLSWSLGLQR